MPTKLFATCLEQLPLALAWVLYALIHSLTASLACKAFVKRRLPRFFASYRLAYNLLALLLLVPLAALAWARPGPDLWRFDGAAGWIANGVALAALLSFLRHGGGYDLPVFLGLRRETNEATGGNAPRLIISGWHRHVRHPWYTLGLVLIWSRDMNAASLVSGLAVTLYFVFGSRLEEQKLIVEFGERYLAYRRRVPALLPWPGRQLSREEADRLAG